MPFAAGVKFSKDSFSKYFNPGETSVAVDDFVFVKDPDLGVERIGFVSILEGRAKIQMDHLPRLIRPATEQEIEEWYDIKIREKEGLAIVREKAAQYNLPVKISSVTILPDRQQVLVNFTSERRVDFREMVKDLAGHFKSRIEMWQIGARQEAGMQNGYGVCGNPLCCGSWLKDFPSISMRYAKEQDIIQPPSKLSGPCGKLRCCLRYEHETYLELAEGVPVQGCAGCLAGGGCGVVIDRNLLKGTVTVRPENGDIKVVPFSEFTPDPDQKVTSRSRGNQERRGRGRAETYEEADETVSERDE
ncbi:stage 0 sporulation protein [Candidatus Sumerlaeota bacterium]|nr:stage 0 sporulation protein [Candidatus Sumerlaeota bacterium]